MVTIGHRGINGNEKSNRIARESTNNPRAEIRTYY